MQKRIFPYLIRLGYLLLGVLILTSCSQHGCPGGMCAPSHYYSSPKSIWSMGGPSKSKIKYKNKGRSRQRGYTHYRSPRSVRSLNYNPRWNFSSPSSSRNIDGGSFRTRRGRSHSANIEGGVFRNSGSSRRSANIEGGTFRTSGSKYKSANIEGGAFRSGRSKTFTTDIETSPFKVRRHAKRNTNKVHKAIRYKEPNDRAAKKSKYGLFDPEIEGWEKRAAKTRKPKTRKAGHGVKKIDQD